MLGRVPLPSLPLPNLHPCSVDRSINEPGRSAHEPCPRSCSPRSTKSSEEKQKAFSIDALVAKNSITTPINETKPHQAANQSVNPMIAMLQNQFQTKSPTPSNVTNSISNLIGPISNPLLSQSPISPTMVAQAALYQKIAMQQKLQQLQQQQMIAQQLLNQQAAASSSVEMIQQLAEIQKRVAIQNLTGQIWSSSGHPMVTTTSVTSPNGSLAASRDNSTSSTSGSDKDSDSPKPIEMLTIC